MSESFEYYFESNDLHMKYACSAPAVSGEEYHDYCELVFFFGGNVRFISTEIQQELKEGNVIMIPKGAFHQFVVSDSDYTRCILSFRKAGELDDLISSTISEVKIIEKAGPSLKHLIDGLIESIKWDISESEKSLYIKSNAVLLLTELKKTSSGIVSKNINISKTVHDAISIINRSYSSPITVEELAKQLCVSPSLLSHKFKKEMNVSVYKYVTKKRLSVARQLIDSGVPITTAALRCGFADYSCFLRAYKSQYSQKPSEK